jgi:glutamine phosphoribosylpyrophosphate amidotransferase
MQSFSMSCDSSISHSCFHKHVRLQYFVHNLNYKIQSKNPCHHLQAAVHTLNSGYLFIILRNPDSILAVRLDHFYKPLCAVLGKSDFYIDTFFRAVL